MFKKIMVCTFVFSLVAGSCFAMENMSQSATEMNSSSNSQEGKFIHSAKVKGYNLNFYLINMKAKMAEIATSSKTNMEKMNVGSMKSHHLMLYILDTNGKKVSDAKVGYMVTAPDGTKQKTMTMGMSGGYGADVDLNTGTYKIMTKALVNGQKVINTFDLKM